MLGSKILVAYDGSELARKALAKAFELAQDNPEIRIEAVFVDEVTLLRTGAEAINDEVQKRNDRICSDLQTMLAGRRERITFHRLRGQGASYVLLRFAEENGNDLIVLGCRGLTGVRELLGSVSHAVVQHALVPVLIIK